MTRDEKIQFCRESAEQFGEPSELTRFVYLTDEDLDECVERFDYLWEK